MDIFKNAAVVRFKGAHGSYLFANDNRSVTQQKSPGGGAEWTVEHVSGGRAIRLKSIYNQYLNATDFAFILGMTGKQVRQSYASKADSAVEWEPVSYGQYVKLKTKTGSFLRANGVIWPYRKSITHDTPKSPATQNWILWEVQVVQSLSDGPLPEENSPTRLPSSLKESPLTSMSPKGGMRNSSLKEESPLASMLPKGGLRNKPLQDMNLEEETDEEEQTHVISSHAQVPHPLASSGAHASPAHGRNNLSPDRPIVEHEQPESSHCSYSENEGSSVDESEVPPRQAQVQNLSRPKHQEHLAQRRRNASEDERVSAQRVGQAPRRRSDMAYYDGESGPRQVQSPRMRQQGIFNEEGEEEGQEEPAGYQSRHDGREQRTPRITHAQGRRHQYSHDDREKLRRRRNGTSSHEQNPREWMEPSTARRDERFVEEFNRRHGGGQFSPMSPRSTDMPRHTERVRRERVAQPPLRRNERELDERGEESSVESSPRVHQRPVDERGHRRRAELSDVERRRRSRAHPRSDARRVEYDNSDEEQPARSRVHVRNDARRVEYDNSDEEQRPFSRVHVGNDARRVEYDNSDEEQRPFSRVHVGNDARRVEYDNSDEEQRPFSRVHVGNDARRVEYDNSDEEQRPVSRVHVGNDARRVEYDNSDEEQRPVSRVHVGNDARRVKYDNSDEEQRARRIQPRRVEYDSSDGEQRTPRTQPIRNYAKQQQQQRHRRDGSSALREERHHYEYVEEPSPRRKSRAGSVDDGGESSTSTRSSQRAGVKRIFFSVMDESGEAVAAGEDEWGSFLFEGTTLEELEDELHRISGIDEDFHICVRIPPSGKLSILRLIPAVQGPLHVELVPVNSAAGRAFAKPHSVRTRYSRESNDL